VHKGKSAIIFLMLLKNVKLRYFSDLTEQHGGDTRKLFQVVTSLSTKPDENQLPPMMTSAS